MARKERNSVDYFPHGIKHGKKMFYIRNQYKNDGYAVWFMLLEKLSSAEYHYLDLKNDLELMYLSSEFMVSKEVLLSIINDLVNMEEFDSEFWLSERILFNEKFIENIQDAYKKRANECINKKSLLSLLQSKGRSFEVKSNLIDSKSTLDSPVGTHIKEYNSKEDNIIEYKKKVNNKKPKYNFREKLLDYGFKENLVNDWMLIRKTKQATDTETTFNKFIREIELATEDKNELLEFIVGKEWRSFEYQWIVNLQSEFKKQQDRNNGQVNKQTKQYVPSDSLKENIAKRLYPENFT
jgi:hypothetical protein